jgi:lycopene cyclase domain-containing protein
MLSFTYLLINFFSVFVPVCLSFETKIKFYKIFPSLFKAVSIVSLVFVIWDIIFTHLGVWGFTEKYLCGIKFLNLPLEELLFFICVPYACIFTYEVLKYYFPKPFEGFNFTYLNIGLALFLFALAFISYDKAYTFYTSLFMAISLLVLRKSFFLPNFYLMYLVTLIPFFIVNGLLTGIVFDEPVVFYNNAENLSIRAFTIPVEDFIYGGVMLIWNVFLVEYFGTARDCSPYKLGV